MTKSMKTTAQAESLPIPNPPGGGSWKWNGSAREWVPNQPEVQPEDKPQE